jgi:nucleotide-binding universal stress UspA family protein
MRIVVGYDGSEAAKRALAHAVALAGPDDVVVVVAVAEIHARPVLTEGALLDPSEIQQRQHDLEEAKAFLAEREVQADVVLGQGDPATVITELAKERDADLIVVGRRGLNPIERLLLGSVSSKVVQRADRDVLVVATSEGLAGEHH